MKKARFVRSEIMKRLSDLEAQKNFEEKPYLAFVARLPDGRYEVSEHIRTASGSVRYENKIFDTKEDYFKQCPDWVVIHGEEEMTDVLHGVLDGDETKYKVLNG